MNTRISGRDCECPYCKRKLAVVINHFLPKDRDKLESVEIEKDTH